ncbi:MAG: metallophosphoesterase family protein [Nitrospinae bacterium]|nr:metallophosphoesterase family protein [Nitrospinota bacterium]
MGVISDTHGLLRPEALTALKGSYVIIHAGDIGKPEVLEELQRIAPVVAVRGNNDKGPWAETLPSTKIITVGGVSLYVLHNLKELDLDLAKANIKAVISGHSHKPFFQEQHGVMYLNPGSAGPRRFTLPVTVGRIHIHSTGLKPELVDLAL